MSVGSLEKRDQRGFNLIEVIIAMAMLGTVLLSVVTLFVAGRTNVYGGKTMSQGVAIGTHVMEDLSSLSLADVQRVFGVANGAAIGNVDVDPNIVHPTDLYTASLLRTTRNISETTDPSGYMQRWLDEINNDNKMGNAFVAVVLTPMNNDPAITAKNALAVAPFGDATVMRVRTIVRWQEGLRWREVVLDTVKTRRP
jgi:prepilin-type N-terminal cleavage/methylation domain-containing protein